MTTIERKCVCRILSVALLTAAVTVAAGAATLPGFPAAQPGKTTVGVQTADVSPETLSFTVPLYVTVAAVEQSGTPTLICPDNYTIRNTSASGADGNTYPHIAVTGLTVEAVQGGTWSLKTTPGGARELSMSIGSLSLPEIEAGVSIPQEVGLTAQDSAFYSTVTGKFTPIAGGPDMPGLSLPVAGNLSASYSAGEEKTAAQFKVKYTVSLLDAAGDPIGAVYDGPTKEDAALPHPGPIPTS